MSSPRPSVAAPAPSSSAPEFAFAEPDEKMSILLPPFTPEFADRIVMAPLDVAVPRPTPPSQPRPCSPCPPRKHLHQPAATAVPPPTVSATSPRDRPSPRPCRAPARPNYPLATDEKMSIPLTPLTPEFADRIVMAPLDVAVPSPDATVTTPPVFTAPPASTSTSRRYRSPLPTVSAMSPRTVRRRPVPSSSAPELPAFADPDEKMSIPLPPFAPNLPTES